ncbi:MAG: hypothetical protein KDF65_11850, partial [Anaerolineae bacterium]|nr:hypothetical protein [Anaerolineae bacterium]
QRAEVYVFSEGLSEAQIEQALFTPCRDISATVAALQQKYGPAARLCVIPTGPQTIAYVEPAGKSITNTVP